MPFFSLAGSINFFIHDWKVTISQCQNKCLDSKGPKKLSVIQEFLELHNTCIRIRGRRRLLSTVGTWTRTRTNAWARVREGVSGLPPLEMFLNRDLGVQCVVNRTFSVFIFFLFTLGTYLILKQNKLLSSQNWIPQFRRSWFNFVRNSKFKNGRRTIAKPHYAFLLFFLAMVWQKMHHKRCCKERYLILLQFRKTEMNKAVEKSPQPLLRPWGMELRAKPIKRVWV